MTSLNILHVMRAPVGGLFRHVIDLADAQAAAGHRVGIVADSATGAARAETILSELVPRLAHGVTRMPMSRHPSWSDVAARRRVGELAERCAADVVHGHGAKGGAYARLLAKGRAIRVYTPHGGSLHYSRSSPLGLVYLTLERLLMPRTELFLFESAYGRDVFEARVGSPRSLVRVVHNGVTEAEFEPVSAAADATDLLFVGELRLLKGVDVMIDALALLRDQGRVLTLTIVGDGPDGSAFRNQVQARRLTEQVTFAGVLPARTAFARGRLLLVPSRAESLPYIILEAAAAGIPLIASNVGGIPEIIGEFPERLVPAGDVAALAKAVAHCVDESPVAKNTSEMLQGFVRERFSVATMTRDVLAGYAEARG